MSDERKLRIEWLKYKYFYFVALLKSVVNSVSFVTLWVLVLGVIGFAFSEGCDLLEREHFKELIFIFISALGFFYFLLKQKLDESKYFVEQFSRLNERYDRLNEFMNHVVAERHLTLENINGENDSYVAGRDIDGLSVSRNVKDILNDYFNLCSEEYLLFKKGYIPITVWKAWSKGMGFYFNSSFVVAAYEEELKNSGIDSYYGFHFKTLGHGKVFD